MLPRPTAALVLSLAALLAAPAGARGALAVHVSVEELARGSDAVVRGRVEARRTVEGGGRLWTEVKVRAASRWRGDAPDVVTLLVPGGSNGRFVQHVDGAPVFDAREEVVLFLFRTPDGRYRVTGLAQGKYRVDGAVAKPDLHGTTFVKDGVANGERGSGEISIAELERRVRAAR